MTETGPEPGAALAGYWEIHCDATLQALVDGPTCPDLFRRTLTGYLSWHVRNRTTIERVLTTPSTAVAWFAAILALGAEVRVEGQGEVPVDAFLERRIKGRLEALHIPLPRPGAVPLEGVAWGEARVARTHSDEPIVSAVAVVEGGEPVVIRARLALTGACSRPAGLAKAAAHLVGNPLTLDTIRDVATAVEAEVMPKGDFLGSTEYRRAMAGVMARRALEECLAGHNTETGTGCAAHGSSTREGGHGR
ncbi:MAG TPA: hypothetical protein PKO09_04195 [Anaerolineae bacterium]|nr:hypothetical protein [Anaerolineae bacterium]